MSKSFPGIMVGLAMTCAIIAFIPWKMAEAETFSIRVEAHPNHYILLLDASGSTVSTVAKQTAYRRALSLLLSVVYEGFGPNIPPFDPHRDVLTLHHFGIVRKGSSPAYMRLRDHRFGRDYVHPVFIRHGSVTKDLLQERLAPHEFYQLTVLSWAKQLALLASSPERPDETSHRTFLFFLHDGLSNEGSLAEEISMVERWGNAADVSEAKSIVDNINREYAFSDGKGAAGWAWYQRIQAGHDDNNVVFLEAYEVVSHTQKSWEAAAGLLRPFRHVGIRWTKERGGAPEGVLTAVLDATSIARLGLTETSTVSLGLVAGPHPNASQFRIAPVLKLPVMVPGPLGREQKRYQATLDIPAGRQDKLLGNRVVHLIYGVDALAPVPFFYSVLFIIAWIGAIALGIVVVLYVNFRYRTTHIRIALPGLIIPIRLGRNGTMKAGTPISPKEGLELFSLELPSVFSQYLLYRNAKLELKSANGAAAHWEGLDTPSLRLPTKLNRISAVWSRMPTGPAELSLWFRQGGREAELVLSFP